MKKMSDKKLAWGSEKSDDFFPKGVHMKDLKKVGSPSGFKYPDSAEAIERDQSKSLSTMNNNKPKEGFRH